jgi:hypothetical protein
MEIYKSLDIPHLRFTVRFMDMKYLKGIEVQGSGYTCISGENEATIFIENIEQTVTDLKLTPWLAHEIVHVLQIICTKYNMRFENEQEHMAYLMHYLLSELLS